MSFIRNTVTNFAGRIIVLLTTIIVEIVIARYFGPSGKGLYALLLIWTTIQTMIAHHGFSRACIYYYQLDALNKADVVNQTIAYTIVSGAVFSIIGLIILAAIEPNSIVGIPVASSVLLLAFAPAFVSVLAVSNIYKAVHNFLGSNLVVAAYRGATLFGIIFLITIGNHSENSLALTMVFGGSVAAIGGWYFIYRYFGNISKFYWNPDLFRRMMSYGLRAVSFNFITVVNTRIDHLLIGHFLGLAQLGLYSAAIVLAELTNKLATVLAEVMFSRASGLSNEESERLSTKLLRLTILASLMFILTISVLAEVVITLVFGREFAGSTVVLLILLPGGMFLNITIIVGTHLSARGKPELVAISSLIATVSIVIGNLFLTPRFGLYGAAFVAVIANFATMVVCLFHYLKRSSGSLSDLIPAYSDCKEIVLFLLNVRIKKTT